MLLAHTMFIASHASASCMHMHAGLDARAAAIVMRAVRNVARNGRTVMVTIHQPSIEIFEAFDFLYLLQVGRLGAVRGGSPAYTSVGGFQFQF